MTGRPRTIDYERLADLRRAGLTLAACAETMGCKAGTLRKIATRLGFTKRRRPGFRPRLDHAEILAAIARGATSREVAAKFGCHPGTVRKIVWAARKAAPRPAASARPAAITMPALSWGGR